jgi:hypothetical protein
MEQTISFSIDTTTHRRKVIALSTQQHKAMIRHDVMKTIKGFPIRYHVTLQINSASSLTTG